MAGDKIKSADKGKSPVISERQSFNPVRVAAQQREKLVLDSRREFLKGGSGRGETTRQQETTKLQNTIRLTAAGKWVQDQMGTEKTRLHREYEYIIKRGRTPSQAQRDALNEYQHKMQEYKQRHQGQSSRQQESSHQQGEESISQNQQEETGVSQYLRSQYPGQQPSQHGYYYPPDETTWDEWFEKHHG